MANNNGNLVCESGGGSGGSGGQLPGGSWDQSCRNGSMQNGMLYAQCQRTDGSRRDSSIDPRSCNGGRVANNNGNLVCESGGGNANSEFPRGDWRDSCRDARMEGSILRASCQKFDGRWTDAWIDMNRCSSGKVYSNNGLLLCK